MLICGSCFRHQTPKLRLKTLCTIYLDMLETPDQPAPTGRNLCQSCSLPLVANPSWSMASLLSALKRTADAIPQQMPT